MTGWSAFQYCPRMTSSFLFVAFSIKHRSYGLNPSVREGNIYVQALELTNGSSMVPHRRQRGLYQGMTNVYVSFI